VDPRVSGQARKSSDKVAWARMHDMYTVAVNCYWWKLRRADGSVS